DLDPGAVRPVEAPRPAERHLDHGAREDAGGQATRRAAAGAAANGPAVLRPAGRAGRSRAGPAARARCNREGPRIHRRRREAEGRALSHVRRRGRDPGPTDLCDTTGCGRDRQTALDGQMITATRSEAMETTTLAAQVFRLRTPLLSQGRSHTILA